MVAAVIVAALYIRDFFPKSTPEPEMLTHIRHILDVRDAYKSPEVLAKCNALMEAMLGIKQ